MSIFHMSTSLAASCPWTVIVHFLSANGNNPGIILSGLSYYFKCFAAKWLFNSYASLMQMDMQEGLNAMNMIVLQLQPMKCVFAQVELVHKACSLQAVGKTGRLNTT